MPRWRAITRKIHDDIYVSYHNCLYILHIMACIIDAVGLIACSLDRGKLCIILFYDLDMLSIFFTQLYDISLVSAYYIKLHIWMTRCHDDLFWSNDFIICWVPQLFFDRRVVFKHYTLMMSNRNVDLVLFQARIYLKSKYHDSNIDLFAISNYLELSERKIDYQTRQRQVMSKVEVGTSLNCVPVSCLSNCNSW